jgi:hypothetical protein
MTRPASADTRSSSSANQAHFIHKINIKMAINEMQLKM